MLAVRLFQEPAGELGGEQAGRPRPLATDQVAAGRADHVLPVERLVAGWRLCEAARQRAVLKKSQHRDVMPAADGAGNPARAAGRCDLVAGDDPPLARPARAANRLLGVPDLAVWTAADTAPHQAERPRHVERGQEPRAGVTPGRGAFD
ncbi:MAG TPA: hypothetical protein VHZ03_57315 [Trebonia sp.]|nr:hypothetical protein [Trebonia sp.]